MHRGVQVQVGGSRSRGGVDLDDCSEGFVGLYVSKGVEEHSRSFPSNNGAVGFRASFRFREVEEEFSSTRAYDFHIRVVGDPHAWVVEVSDAEEESFVEFYEFVFRVFLVTVRV